MNNKLSLKNIIILLIIFSLGIGITPSLFAVGYNKRKKKEFTGSKNLHEVSLKSMIPCHGCFAHFVTMYPGQTGPSPGGTYATFIPVSSSNTSVADVVGGNVIAISPGTATIFGTVPQGMPGHCGVGSTQDVSFSVTVLPPPSSLGITGASSVCEGGSTNLSGSPSGGSWSTSNSSIATVNNSGQVIGVSSGTVTITYTKNFSYEYASCDG